MVQITGGRKLEAALAEIASHLQSGKTLRVGFLEGATYPNGTPVALIAMVQDFGAPSRGIPPRPFFRNMVAKESPGWPETLKGILRQTNYDARTALELMGEEIKGDLQQSIRDTNSPPLAPATIKRKGFDKPLIDTSHMINSVDYDVT